MTISSFADLKKNRKSMFEDLKNKLQAENTSQSDKSNEFWKPTVDKAGNGFAVIRFLETPEGESAPMIKYWDHAFKGPSGKWYIEKSRTTLGRDERDPVGEMNRQLWESGMQANKDIVSGTPSVPGTKRRLHYVSNVYIIKDSGNPENEGKVFKYVYGKKIYDMINDLLYPQFEDEASINPFDLWEGCVFNMKIRNKDGYRSYDKSEFGKPSPLFEDDAKIEAVWKQCYSLEAIIAPDQFKTYAELSKKLSEVMNSNAMPAASEYREEKRQEAPVAPSRAPKEEPEAAPPWDADAEEDSPLSFFKNLAAD